MNEIGNHFLASSLSQSLNVITCRLPVRDQLHSAWSMSESSLTPNRFAVITQETQTVD